MVVWRTVEEFTNFMGAIIEGHPQFVQPDGGHGSRVMLGMEDLDRPFIVFIPHGEAADFRMDLQGLVNQVGWQQQACEAILAGLY